MGAIDSKQLTLQKAFHAGSQCYKNFHSIILLVLVNVYPMLIWLLIGTNRASDVAQICNHFKLRFGIRSNRLSTPQSEPVPGYRAGNLAFITDDYGYPLEEYRTVENIIHIIQNSKL